MTGGDQGSDHDVRIGVVGAGSWGTAIANLLADKGCPLDLWAYEQEVVDQITEAGENRVFLPGVNLSENLRPTTDLARVARDKDMLVVVCPSHVLRETATRMAPEIDPDTILVSATKGIETGTHKLMTEVLDEVVEQVPEDRICAISGPSFAREVAMGMPTLVTVAGRNEEVAKAVQYAFATPVFRVYMNPDMVGVQLAGAVKNVHAIASGISEGLGMGTNTRAALITRGLAEINRLGAAMGADPRTFMGLAGVGDLVLTCTAELSRNYSLGKKMGQGHKLEDILAGMRMVAEGVQTARSLYNLTRKINVEMPIAEMCYRVLFEDMAPGLALMALMTRALKDELRDTPV
ncbi:MAG: NAD(P)H-dependent glycerol-3-phosphate dehydrogenase [Desulfatibacillaceae bacterium]